MFNNKKVLFYGPGVRSCEPNVNEYDYVILTNNQISFFFDKYDLSDATKVFLYINHHFARWRGRVIGKHMGQIYGYLGLRESLHRLPRSMREISFITPRFDDWWPEKEKKQPLGFTHVLMLLRKYELESLDVVGVDFYEGEKAYEEDGYLSHGLKKRPIEEEREIIDWYRGIAENKAYFARYAEKQKNVRIL